MDALLRTTSRDQSQPFTIAPSSPSTQRSPAFSSDSTFKIALPSTTDPPSATNPPKQKVWVIFGATGHMGRSVTKTALAHGDLVCAVGQSLQDSPSTLSTLLSVLSNASSTNYADTYLGLLCDVRIRASVSSTLDKTIAHFGRIDIIANCTGYGVIGACEDQDEHEIRNQFETNFMGTLNIIQLSLPHFRKRQAGRYLIFSSTSGALGVPGLGPYCATKYAVEGLIESMLYEVDPFGIRATLVEPGHLRRDDGGVGSSTAASTGAQGAVGVPTTNGSGAGVSRPGTAAAGSAGAGNSVNTLPLFGHFKVAKASEPYTGRDAPAAHAQRTLHWIGNNQPVSVVKAAELVWQLGHCRYPPLRLILGTFAVESIRDRLKSIIEEIEDWKHLSFPPLEPEPDADGEVDGEGEGEDDADEQGDGDEMDRDGGDDDNDDDNTDGGDRCDDRKRAETKPQQRGATNYEGTPEVKMEDRMDVDR
ncbi:hypothetical protein PV08_05583 [Exophiala spinifera]|uniref:Uncharacterized protein n=1 Tax=Exophiala spinifera TaxID=91928 RepID=A0A0D2BAF2_9EURO|nr:uncharacterized protein PV08_05583 [Exophiala spinifera]KIW15535.1 hypothetical protein PV08_05583 [Exophiala spinifera]